MKKTVVFAFVAVVAVLALQTSLQASDPIGLYTVIEKVTFEPNEAGATRIQIWGAFAMADPKDVNNYLAPQKGYLYVTLPAGKEDVAKKEWADLKAVAGTGQGVGIGSRWSLNMRVRKAEDKPATPDVYSMGFGVVKVGAGRGQASVVEALKALLKKS